MPDKTTQKIKEKIPSIETMLNCLRLEVDESIVRDVSKTIYEALSQQQQEDDQDVLDLDIMKDEKAGDVRFISSNFYTLTDWRNQFREELRQAIAQKRGEV